MKMDLTPFIIKLDINYLWRPRPFIKNVRPRYNYSVS